MAIQKCEMLSPQKPEGKNSFHEYGTMHETFHFFFSWKEWRRCALLLCLVTKDSFGPSTGIYECRSSKAISDLFVAAFSTTISSNFPPLTHANFFHTGTFVYAPNSPRQYVQRCLVTKGFKTEFNYPLSNKYSFQGLSIRRKEWWRRCMIEGKEEKLFCHRTTRTNLFF